MANNPNLRGIELTDAQAYVQNGEIIVKATAAGAPGTKFAFVIQRTELALLLSSQLESCVHAIAFMNSAENI